MLKQFQEKTRFIQKRQLENQQIFHQIPSNSSVFSAELKMSATTEEEITFTMGGPLR